MEVVLYAGEKQTAGCVARFFFHKRLDIQPDSSPFIMKEVHKAAG
jgi:hypothetical protein